MQTKNCEENRIFSESVVLRKSEEKPRFYMLKKLGFPIFLLEYRAKQNKQNKSKISSKVYRRCCVEHMCLISEKNTKP